jgi:hypothetical protein
MIGFGQPSQLGMSPGSAFGQKSVLGGGGAVGNSASIFGSTATGGGFGNFAK